MAEDRKRPAKSESLTIRLNPRTRFILEFVSRKRGQTITTVVERALEAAGDQALIKDFEGKDLSWKDYWDVVEGVRALNVSAEPELFPTYEEEIRLQFARKFKEYFYKDNNYVYPHKTYLEVLWPKIDYLLNMFDETKATDHFAVEKEMRGLLWKAGVKPPESRSGVTAKTVDRRDVYDLDDDIPF